MSQSQTDRKDYEEIWVSSEFKNKIIDEIIATFGIERSLSAKGKPIGNAVAEAMYNIVKTKFAYGEDFADLDELELKWFDYVNWYNNVRIHGTLGYLSPAEYESRCGYTGLG